MIYTAELVERAVREAAAGGRQTGTAEERDRICRIIAAQAAITLNEAAREELWEVIRHVRGGQL